ncbi:MAG: metallophosphoesterase [Actinomycetota bacterium]
MTDVENLLLSCWIVEAARAAVLSGRGHGAASVRSAQRARILAGALSRSGQKIVPRYASEHAQWQAQVAGSAEETGPIGWFFLQRLGMYVDAHIQALVSDDDLARMHDLLAPDEAEVNEALVNGGLPPAPPADWPSVERAMIPSDAEPGGAEPGGAQPSVPGPTGPASSDPASTFAILGDPHIGHRSSAPLVAAAIDDINAIGVDFVVVIGDLTQNGSIEFFEQAAKTFARFESPVLLTVGNHDMWGGATDFAVGRKMFQQVFTRATSFVHTLGGVRAIVLDSADPSPSPFPPFDLLSGRFHEAPHESVPGGRFDDETLGFIESIGPAETSFVFLHHPPFPYLGFPPLVFGLDQQSTDALTKMNDRVSPAAIFCGHTHRSAISSLDDTVVLEVPSCKEWPFGFGLVEVNKHGWAYNLIPISDRKVVEEASGSAGLLFRRYGRGPDEARAFSTTF